MTATLWADVDRYINGLLAPPDPALTAALEASAAAGLPDIQVTPTQGKLLHLFARMIGAKRILEVGTLGGYSTIWMARALPPDGKLITLEIDAKHAEVARANLARAGLADRVDVRLGPALESLPKLALASRAQGGAGGAFDLVFIDADKPSNPEYFAWALKLSRRGSVIIVDNVIRDGGVVNASSSDPNILGVRRLNDLIAREPRVSATEIQTVGSKGYDGFAIAVVLAEP